MSEVKRCTIGLGTFIEFTFPAAAEAVYFDAVTLLRALEAQLSFFDAGSDVSRWNALGPGDTGEFGARFIYLLEMCAELNALSGGVFDPRPAGLRETAAFKDSFSIDGRRVQKRKAMTVDFGGIAKGYIVDQLVECFMDRGVASGVVNAGGDLRCWGDVKRPVHIRLGQQAVSNEPIEIENAAVAGSGWAPYCTVKAESAVLADAFTKIYMAAPDVAESVSKQLNARVELVSWLGS